MILYGSQKLSIGGPAEKIVSAFHLVLSEQSIEDAEMSKCKSAIQRVRKMEKDVDMACSIGKHTTEQTNTCILELGILIWISFSAKDPKRKTLAKELEEEENLLKQCIEKLKLVKANRVVLVSQLKEALHEQVSYDADVIGGFLYLSPAFFRCLVVPNCILLLYLWILVSGN